MNHIFKPWKLFTICLAVSVSLFLLYFGNWHFLFDSPGLRFVIGYIAFIIPGFCISVLVFSQRKLPEYLISHIVIGFGISLCLVALLAIPALVFNWPFLYIRVVISCLAIYFINVLLWFPVVDLAPIRRFYRTSNTKTIIGAMLAISLALVAIAFVVIVVAAYNFNGPVTIGSFGNFPGYTDNALYNAYITEYQHSMRLTITETIFNSDNLPFSRHYFHMWPMAQAVIASIADVNILQVFHLQVVILVIMTAGAILTLARSFRYSYIYALLAAAGHLSVISALLGNFEPGQLLFFRVNQDKFFYIFIFSNILLAVFKLHNIAPGRRTYVIYFSLVIVSVLIHPTAPIFMGLVFALYLLFQLVAKPSNFKHIVYLSLPWVFAGAIVIGLRLLVPGDINIVTSVTYEDILQMSEVRLERNEYRLTFIAGTKFYAVNVNVWGSPLFIGNFLAVTGVIYFIFKSRGERINELAIYIIIISSLIVSLLIPYTAWLIGTLITPFHIWRYLAYTPFGLTFMCLTYIILKSSQLSVFRSQLVIGGICILFSLVTLHQALTGPSVIREFISSPHTIVNRHVFKEYAYIGQLIDASEPDKKRVIVLEMPIRDHVPAISSKTVPVTFRTASTVSMINQGGLDAIEATRRMNLYRNLIDLETSPEVRRGLIINQNIDYIIWIKNDIPESVLYSLLPVLQPVYEGDYLSLYRVQRN